MSQGPTDAQKSQGLIQNPQSEINQRFGDEQTIDTGGGDSAGGNLDKRNFINVFIGTEPSSSLTAQTLQDLLQVLEQYGEGKLVKQAYKESLPADSYVSRPEAGSYRAMVAQLQEFRRLQQFLMRLAADPDMPEAIRNRLNDFRTQEEEAPPNQGDLSAQNLKSGVQAYLQIVLRPDLSSDGLVVNAWLIPDDTVSDLAKRYQPLDLDEIRKGTTCQIDEVPTILNQFLNQALQYLTGQRYELTVEVFLPLDHLYVDVDGWELTDLFFEDETYLVGTKYQVLVRSQERLDPRYLASRSNQWHNNWDRVKTRLSSVPGQDDFEHLSEMETCNWKQLVNRLKQKLGLKLTCGLVETNQKDLFTCILKAAAPIAIWPRLDLDHLDQVSEIEQLVASGPLLKLLETIRQKREEADCDSCPASHLGSHLAVLWEDPNRLTPDALAQLKPPGQ